MDTRTKKNPIAGYMGYVPQQQESQQQYTSPQTLNQSHIPGYVGFIPAVQAQNLYANTYGKITQNCANHAYYRGIQHPNDYKYISTTKLTYKNPNDIKNQQLAQGKINGVKLSTFSNTAMLMMGNSNGMNKSSEYTKQTITKLTYQDACRKAFN